MLDVISVSGTDSLRLHSSVEAQWLRLCYGGQGMAWKANEQVRAHLLGDLYESVLAPERVPDVLRALNAHLDCDGS